ncbi:hypothetical protein V8E54_003484 [Elaphomyces granulatus]
MASLAFPALMWGWLMGNVKSSDWTWLCLTLLAILANAITCDDQLYRDALFDVEVICLKAVGQVEVLPLTVLPKFSKMLFHFHKIFDRCLSQSDESFALEIYS